MTAAEILEATARTVEAGWCQRIEWKPRRHGEQEQRCVLGAIRFVVRAHWTSETDMAIEAIRKEIAAPMWMTLTYWNDVPGRTAEEVAATVRNAKRWL